MEKLKTFFKSKTWRIIWGTLKLFISIPIFCVSVFYINKFLFSSNNKLFVFAGDTQGSFYSEFMFDRLLKSEPKNSKFWWESSVAYNKRGDFEEGMRRLNKANSLNATDHLGYTGWIKYTKLKDYENALKDFHRLDKLSNVVEYPWGENIYFQMGICYQGLGNYDSAIVYYDKFIASEKNPDNIYPRMYTYRGKIEADRKNYPKALDFYNKTIGLDKNIAEAYYYKAETYRLINQKDSAKVNYNKSLDLIRNNYKNQDAYDEVFLEIYDTEIQDKLKEL
ncbi:MULTISPECIES: tetratricopeptide repeat protein [Empedobacter]|uniref:Tetratricopeptide repeat protein n=1 Tax=Empedobacter falsenii TaxID=343874 RepID=A0A427BS85_9FLAO|nr:MULTISPECIES: tetratricopeptide repeat protein [Empedobacter]MDM1041352.1 tetratricopeptide repeat protein [Empedobacter brevis]MDM1134931.1 tetratricopeptide repeat protein [Empedobacter sp. R750]RRT93829.1 tetratricopeptide repeat protein [Empedobacter falsenii]RRT93984.1 tetratricopeptide repeat protein [Empedobacter falsenii]